MMITQIYILFIQVKKCCYHFLSKSTTFRKHIQVKLKRSAELLLTHQSCTPFFCLLGPCWFCSFPVWLCTHPWNHPCTLQHHTLLSCSHSPSGTLSFKTVSHAHYSITHCSPTVTLFLEHYLSRLLVMHTTVSHTALLQSLSFCYIIFQDIVGHAHYSITHCSPTVTLLLLHYLSRHCWSCTLQHHTLLSYSHSPSATLSFKTVSNAHYSITHCSPAVTLLLEHYLSRQLVMHTTVSHTALLQSLSFWNIIFQDC